MKGLPADQRAALVRPVQADDLIMRMVVDLPAPFGPRKPVTMPGVTSRVSRSTARVLPKRFVRPRT
jgi:hypothetical protein